MSKGHLLGLGPFPWPKDQSAIKYCQPTSRELSWHRFHWATSVPSAVGQWYISLQLRFKRLFLWWKIRRIPLCTFQCEDWCLIFGRSQSPQCKSWSWSVKLSKKSSLCSESCEFYQDNPSFLCAQVQLFLEYTWPCCFLRFRRWYRL